MLPTLYLISIELFMKVKLSAIEYNGKNIVCLYQESLGPNSLLSIVLLWQFISQFAVYDLISSVHWSR